MQNFEINQDTKCLIQMRLNLISGWFQRVFKRWGKLSKKTKEAPQSYIGHVPPHPTLKLTALVSTPPPKLGEQNKDPPLKVRKNHTNH